MAAVAALCFNVHAQTSPKSSVEIYGIVDLGYGHALGAKSNELMQGMASRLGFRGQEDLGGGWNATFHLQHRFNPDTGAQTAARFWHADSWVGISGPYGQVRLGRFVTSSYELAMVTADPFSHVRVGSFVVTHTGAATSPYRFDNSILYQVKFGGFTFSTTFSPSEGVEGVENAHSTALAYQAGKWYVAAGHEDQGGKYDVWNSAVVRWGDEKLQLRGFMGKGRNKENDQIKSHSIAVSTALGPGILMAAYGRLENQTRAKDLQDKISIGYQYPLSKRTRLYVDLAKDRAFAERNKGFDVGMQHNF